MNQRLVGVITTSKSPEALADFYRALLGIPYALQQHGTLPPHWECDVDGIHFAIIKGSAAGGPGNITPSYAVANLDAFLADAEAQGIPRLHGIIELGGGPRICTIADPDGNPVRLYQA